MPSIRKTPLPAVMFVALLMLLAGLMIPTPASAAWNTVTGDARCSGATDAEIVATCDEFNRDTATIVRTSTTKIAALDRKAAKLSAQKTTACKKPKARRGAKVSKKAKAAAAKKCGAAKKKVAAAKSAASAAKSAAQGAIAELQEGLVISLDDIEDAQAEDNGGDLGDDLGDDTGDEGSADDDGASEEFSLRS